MRRKKIRKKLSTRLLSFALALTMVAGSFSANSLMVRASEDSVSASEEATANNSETGTEASGVGTESVTQQPVQNDESNQTAGDAVNGSDDSTQVAQQSENPQNNDEQVGTGNPSSVQPNLNTEADAHASDAQNINESSNTDPNAGIATVEEMVNVYDMKLTARDNTTLAAIPGAYFEI